MRESAGTSDTTDRTARERLEELLAQASLDGNIAFHEALQAARNAVDLAGRIGDPNARLGAHVAHARVALETGDLPEAFASLQAMLAVAQTTGDTASQIRAINLIALCKTDLYDEAGAHADFQQALELARTLPGAHWQQVTLVNTSHAHLCTGRHADALHILNVLAELGEPEDPQVRAVADTNRVHAHEGLAREARDVGRYETSEEHAHAAQRILDALPEDTVRALPVMTRSELLAARARLALLHGQHDLALRIVDERRELVGPTRDPHALGQAELDVAAVLLARHDTQGAAHAYARAAELFDDAGRPAHAITAREGLAQALADLGDPYAALAVQRRITAVTRDLYRQSIRQRAMIQHLERRADDALSLAASLQESASRDPLTGTANRRTLETALEIALKAGRRDDRPAALVMMDVDAFKTVNDTYGHLTGDEVLRRVARLISDGARDVDLVGRYGGEEFLILLPATHEDDAASICERWRHDIETLGVTDLAPGLRVTASFGYTDLTRHPDVQSALREADDRLYRAKRAGRNRVFPPRALPEPA